MCKIHVSKKSSLTQISHSSIIFRFPLLILRRKDDPSESILLGPQKEMPLDPPEFPFQRIQGHHSPFIETFLYY